MRLSEAARRLAKRGALRGARQGAPVAVCRSCEPALTAELLTADQLLARAQAAEASAEVSGYFAHGATAAAEGGEGAAGGLFCVQGHVEPADDLRYVVTYAADSASSPGGSAGSESALDIAARPFSAIYRRRESGGGGEVGFAADIIERVDAATRLELRRAVSSLVGFVRRAHSLTLVGLVAEFVRCAGTGACYLVAAHSTRWEESAGVVVAGEAERWAPSSSAARLPAGVHEGRTSAAHCAESRVAHRKVAGAQAAAAAQQRQFANRPASAGSGGRAASSAPISPASSAFFSPASRALALSPQTPALSPASAAWAEAADAHGHGGGAAPPTPPLSSAGPATQLLSPSSASASASSMSRSARSAQRYSSRTPRGALRGRAAGKAAPSASREGAAKGSSMLGALSAELEATKEALAASQERARQVETAAAAAAAAAEAQSAEGTERIATLEARTGRLESELEAALAAAAAAEKQRAALRSELDAQRAAAEGARADLEGERAATRVALAEFSTRREAMGADVESLTARGESLSADNTRLREELAVQTECVSAVSRQVRDYRARVQTLEVSEAALREEVAALRQLRVGPLPAWAAGRTAAAYRGRGAHVRGGSGNYNASAGEQGDGASEKAVKVQYRSPYMNVPDVAVEVDDLLIEDDDPATQVMRVQDRLKTHSSALQEVFYFYACLGKSSRPNAVPYLSMINFGKCARDIGVMRERPGRYRLMTATVDSIFVKANHAESRENDASNPDRFMVYPEFCEGLIRLAEAAVPKPAGDASGVGGEGSQHGEGGEAPSDNDSQLSARLAVLVTQDVLPNARRRRITANKGKVSLLGMRL